MRFDRHSGQHMLVYPERGLALNESAAAVAKRCDGTRTVRQIVDEIVSEAHAQHPAVEREVVERDVLEMVSELARKGLLER